MATAKVERLLNLVICLLSTRQFVTAEYIRQNVGGYQDAGQSDEAFNRMFERDKNDLRDLGVPLVTGRSPMSGGADGYRIDRDSYELPDISLDREESAAVAMAGALWDTPEITTIAQNAALKLQAAGIDVRADDEIGFAAALSPRSVGSESALAALLSAIASGRAVTLLHRPGSASTSTTRTVEPWGVVTHNGRWYVVGHDRDREATRTFRLSRISGVTPIGKPGEVSVPEGTDLKQIVASAVASASGGGAGTAQIWVAPGSAAGLRRLARHSRPGDLDGEAGDILDIDIRSRSTLTRLVLGAGPDAVVLSPKELRDNVIEGLDGLISVGA